MVAHFSVDNVIKEMSQAEPTTHCTGSAGRKDCFGEKDVHNKVEQWLVKFQCGKDFNKVLFVNAAWSMLLPLATVCQEKKETEAPQLFCTLCSSTINAAVIFRGVSQLWLQCIHRNLAGKRSIRHPYYCEIRRDMKFFYGQNI